MSTITPASAEEVTSFLSDLYGLKVTAVSASRGPDPAAVLATYKDSDAAVRAHIVCDLPCAAMLGAALTQIPKGAVEDAIQSGQLPENLSDNASEVFNIAVNLLPTHTITRLVLAGTASGDSLELPAASDDVHIDHFEISIQRYSTGKMSLIQLG